MISNQILQSTLDGLKGITRTELCVCDIEGNVVATTFDEAGDYGLAEEKPGRNLLRRY